MKSSNLKLLILSLGILLCIDINTVCAQKNQYIDSLKNVVRQTPPDTNRIKIYGKIAWTYAGTRDKLDSAKMYADSITELSEKLDFERGRIVSHFYYGVINRHQGNLVQALNHIEIYTKYYTEKGDSTRLASGLFQLGVVHKNLGNYKESLDIYIRIMNIHKENNYRYGLGFTRHSIGNLQRLLEDYPNAIQSYREAIDIFKDLEAYHDLGMSLESLANTYGDLKQTDSAFHYYQLALDNDTHIGKKYGIASITENIGNMYLKMGDARSALKYQLKALGIRESLPQKANLATSLFKVGKTYQQLGQYDLAEEYLDQSLRLSKELKARPIILDNYLEFAQLYEDQHKFSLAYPYQKKYNLLKDSLLNEDKIRQITYLESKFRNAEKDQQILLLSKENEVSEAKVQKQAVVRNALIGIIILVIIIASLFLYQIRQRLKNQKVISAKNEEIKQKDFQQRLSDLEMKALRAQMNPHFIFNCMNSINKMILANENDDASKYLGKFSKLIRLTLENSEQSTVSLDKELSMLEAYIQLESIRLKGKIKYNLNVDDSIDQSAIQLPSMVLQPFIENAIWHGLQHKDCEGHIKINIQEENDELKCIIEDDGVGREMALELTSKKFGKQESMGLKITEERLKLFGRNKLQNWIQIIDLKDKMNQAIGTRVNISIPIS